MITAYINDQRTKEILKGKTYVSEIPPAIFQGYVNVNKNGYENMVILEINEVNGLPVVVAEAYPEDAPKGYTPKTESFPFDESITIKELLDALTRWVDSTYKTS